MRIEEGKPEQIRSVGTVTIEHPDELSFVDEGIREMFEDCNYIIGMPLMAQLIKELRMLRECLSQYGEE